VRRSPEHQPVSVKTLAMALPRARYRSVAWREGSAGTLRSRFAALRVRPAHRDSWRAAPRPEEWLLIEWPTGEPEPTKYFFATLPASSALKALVASAKLRWRIERDYQDLKQELGLGHYEGRGWRGFSNTIFADQATVVMCVALRIMLRNFRNRWMSVRWFSLKSRFRMKESECPRAVQPWLEYAIGRSTDVL